MKNYVNHFNEYSADYLTYRPDYPDALYDYVLSVVKHHDTAWDVGTGNGQAARKLANYFTEVIATDQSQEQLKLAPKVANIHYYCCSAEKTTIRDHSVDLITVAQALHWFALDQFYQEVNRVIKEDGIIAVWCYSLGSLDDAPRAVNQLVKKLYYEILGDDYWPKERRYIDLKYETIPFPFTKISTPTFMIERNFDFATLIGYLNTWSAVKEYEKDTGSNPVELIMPDLRLAWGAPNTKYRINWPIHLLVGRPLAETQPKQLGDKQ